MTRTVPVVTVPHPYLHGKSPSARPGAGGSYPLLCHLLDTAVVVRCLWADRVRPKLKDHIAEILGETEDEACRVLMLVAAVHDIGKINPFFQYQERHGAASDFSDALEQVLGLPRTDPNLAARMNRNLIHPLRRHEFISHRAVTGRWADNTDPLHGPDWLGMIAGGHQGYWRDPVVNDMSVALGDGDLLVGDGWTSQQNALLHLIEEAIGLRAVDVPSLRSSTSGRAVVAFVSFSGLLTVADWIASDDSRVSAGKQLWTERDDTERDPYLAAEAAQSWMSDRRSELESHARLSLRETADLERPAVIDAVMGDFSPRPLQAEALGLTAETDPGLWICMYPTGDGKTEASWLRWSINLDEGFFFGLPTLATTDAMEDRLIDLAKELPAGALPVIKSHQFAEIMRKNHETETRPGDGCCDQADKSWYTASIRKMVAPNVVGTIDQALTGALAQRHITLRLFGLANHHIILDEVHTYDGYQTELLIELLYWWGMTETRVTFLSATLPKLHMRRMVQAYRAGVRGVPFDSIAEDEAVTGLNAPFPSTVAVSTVDGAVTVTTPEGEIRKPQDTFVEVVPARTRSDRVDSHVEWAKNIAAQHTSSPIAIVSNVVADCTLIAARLRDDPAVTATHEVICLHSSLAAGHRAAVEKRLIERAGRSAHREGFDAAEGQRPILAVGTQVIQASLDFDVDFLATDLAPAPDLLQRLGRSWRFEGTLEGSPRGGRLPADTERSLRVISVVDADGSPTFTGTRPYMTAVLRRTHEALVTCPGWCWT